MAVTKTEVFNDIQNHLGDASLAAWSDDAPRAKRIRDIWKPVVEGVLQLYPYNFASARAQLARVADETNLAYAYVYGRPTGWLRTNWVSPTARREDSVRYGWEDEGGYIVASFDPLFMGYVHDRHVDDCGAWPRVFAQAVASVAARHLSKPATESRSTWADLTETERALLEEAATWDALQTTPHPQRPGRFVASRRGAWW